MSPEITVVIPTRDRWHSLGPSLATALDQRGADLEVVVVDDASAEPAPAWVTRDPRVRVERLATRGGVAKARNTGIAAAQTAWIALLDDDDFWAPDKLRRQLDAATAGGAGFAYASAVAVDDDLSVLGRALAGPPGALAQALLSRNAVPAGGSNVIVRADLLERVGRFDGAFEHLDDWDLWIRLAHAAPAARCEQILVAYVNHARSRVVGHADLLLAEFERLADKHRGVGGAFDRTDFIRWLAVAHRRAGLRRAAVELYLRQPGFGNILRAAVATVGVPVRSTAPPDGRPEWVPNRQSAQASNAWSQLARSSMRRSRR